MSDVTAVSLGDRQVELVIEGSGPPILALHCTGGSARQWRALARILGQDYRIIAPNLCGIGATSRAPSGETWLAYEIETMAKLVAWCGEPVHLLGHSYGGHIAIRLHAVAQPLIRTLTLIEPAVPGRQGISSASALVANSNASSDNTSALKSFFDIAGPPGGWQAMPLRTQAWMMNHADSLINQIRSVVLDGDTNAAIAEVRVPALVIWGTASIPQTMANARTLAARITGACTAIIDGAGHMLPISHADNVNHHIAQFLKV